MLRKLKRHRVFAKKTIKREKYYKIQNTNSSNIQSSLISHGDGIKLKWKKKENEKKIE